MVKTNYANAYKEVLVILDNLIEEDYKKIPKEYIDYLKENCNEEYEFYYDNSKTFEEQNLLDDTKYILFGLFEKFGATQTQKEKIEIFKNNYYRKLEEEKRAKYNSNSIFDKNEANIDMSTSEQQLENSLIERKELIWYKRFFLRIIKIFRKHK